MKKLFYVLCFISLSLYVDAVTVGNTVKGTDTYPVRNTRMGLLVTTGVTGGTVQSISVYLLNTNTDATAKVKAAIYSSNRTTKLGESAEITIPASNDNWVTCNFTTQPTLSASTNYWIVCWVNNPGSGVSVYVSTGSGTSLYATSATYGSWPSDISADDIYSGYLMSMYLNYSEGGTNPVAPTVTTTAISSIAQTTATGGGNVTTDGGASVTARGVCWSTTSNPTTSNSKTTDGTGAGTFNSSITGLTAVTTYHVRAYATNSVGTSYGSDVSFQTSSTPVAPAVTTTSVTSITQTTASSGGNVTADGGATVTTRGVCWSTTSNPTTSNSKTTDGTGTGTFTSAIPARRRL